MTRVCLVLALVAVILGAVAHLRIGGTGADPAPTGPTQEDLDRLRTEVKRLRAEVQELASGVGDLRTDRSTAELVARDPEKEESSTSDQLSPAEAALVARRQQMIRRFHELHGDAKEDALEDLTDLAKRGDPEALREILGALSHDDPEIREGAVEALADLADPAHLDHLIASLEDPSSEVREEAAAALANMPAEEAGPLLIGLLSDEEPGVVSEAIQSLQALRYNAAAPNLVEITRLDDLDLVATAGAALRELGDPTATQWALQRVSADLASDDPLLRIAAIQRIETIGGPGAIAQLEALLQDESVAVRQRATEALEDLREEEAEGNG